MSCLLGGLKHQSAPKASTAIDPSGIYASAGLIPYCNMGQLGSPGEY